MDQIISPFILYGMIALGAVGVCMALPRKGTGPQVIGALLAGIAAGGVILALSLRAKDDHPNVFFYVFGAIALASALRVITHSRPVYASLWFIMVVMASAGLLLILSAEFMAFALVIVYAGAILITYLFVIMLATQAPAEGESEVLAQYDVEAREPIAATVVGFILLALLTTFVFRGLPQVPDTSRNRTEGLLARMPRLVETRLLEANLMQSDERVVSIDVDQGQITLEKADGNGTRLLARRQWPDDLGVSNVQALGFNFLSEHPGTIEIAGVILLMAMLGAVVLSRKQVQMDEDAKLRQARDIAARRLLTNDGGGVA